MPLNFLLPHKSMHVVVLGSPDSWYFKDLVRAAGQRHRVTAATFGQLVSSIGPARASVALADGKNKANGSGQLDLSTADCVLVRTMPPGSLEQVVFRMDALAQLEAAAVPVVNPPKAIEVAVDKYLASARLAAAGLTVPRTRVCQTPEAGMTAFAELGGDVVVKPLFGAEGRGIARLTDEALALRAFKMLCQLGAVLYVQEFIEHEGCDLRLLVLGEQVLGMRRCNQRDWRTNVSRGAATEPLEVTAEWTELAQRAAAAVGAPLAGVDLLPGKNGTLYAIEVNAVPGWRALGRTHSVDVAALVLEYLMSRVERRESSDGLVA